MMYLPEFPPEKKNGAYVIKYSCFSCLSGLFGFSGLFRLSVLFSLFRLSGLFSLSRLSCLSRLFILSRFNVMTVTLTEIGNKV
jgi:hypothetical protein